MIKVTTTKATTRDDWNKLDIVIDTETERKITIVDGSEFFGIRTACNVNGKFMLVSDFDIPEQMVVKLELA